MSFDDVERGYGRGGAWGNTYQGGGGAAYRPGYMASSKSEFERLHQLVLKNIQTINQNVTQITKMVQIMGVPNKDTHDIRIRLRDTIEDTSRLATDTNKSLKDLSNAKSMNPQVCKAPIPF